MITISLREYVELRNKREILQILEAYGIAEWQGYDYAYQQIVNIKKETFRMIRGYLKEIRNENKNRYRYRYTNNQINLVRLNSR